jgi:broad specificity phosphatase PhoE
VTTPETRLYLVRHAETEESAVDRCRGRADVALSAFGWQQARSLAAAFEGVPLVALYSSPSTRTMTTARILGAAVGHQVIGLDDLAEMDFGVFDGRTFTEIEARDPDLFRRWMVAPTAVHFPGGESFGDMKVRALSATGRLRRDHAGASVMSVTHAGPIRAILADALMVPDAAVFRLEISPSSVSVIDWIDGEPLVRGVNLKMHGDVRTPA